MTEALLLSKTIFLLNKIEGDQWRLDWEEVCTLNCDKVRASFRIKSVGKETPISNKITSYDMNASGVFSNIV